jgi:hypothetical protein
VDLVELFSNQRTLYMPVHGGGWSVEEVNP